MSLAKQWAMPSVIHLCSDELVLINLDLSILVLSDLSLEEEELLLPQGLTSRYCAVWLLFRCDSKFVVLP